MCQAFPAFGAERRGAPVTAFVRTRRTDPAAAQVRNPHYRDRAGRHAAARRRNRCRAAPGRHAGQHRPRRDEVADQFGCRVLAVAGDRNGGRCDRPADPEHSPSGGISDRPGRFPSRRSASAEVSASPARRWRRTCSWSASRRIGRTGRMEGNGRCVTRLKAARPSPRGRTVQTRRCRGLPDHAADPYRRGLSKLVADGDMHTEFVSVESEFSAASVVLGAAATGARAYTATASQGVLLMSEVLFNIAGMRVPLVMTVANRAVSAPLSIWNDHSDSMAVRDSGWIQLHAPTTRRPSIPRSRRSASRNRRNCR
jgi:hypothetical protein